MKKYYIYEQDYEILDTEHEEIFGFYCNYKYKIRYINFVCIGYVIGAQEVYDYLKYKKCVDSYSYPTLVTYIQQKRYLIIDEKGNIRNFEELTKNVKRKKRRSQKCHPYQCRYKFKIKNELKQILTKEEIELCLEYGVNIKPIRGKRKELCESWDWYGYDRPNKKGKSWKEQSKRKRQWKNIKNL